MPLNKTADPPHQPRHRTLETHAVNRKVAQASGIVEPVNKGKSGDQHGQREGPHLDIARSYFHVSGSRDGRYALCSM